MFRRNLKNNLKNKIMRDNKFISVMFNFIKVIINFDNKLYEKVMKKRYN